jgi:hypothetical protein
MRFRGEEQTLPRLSRFVDRDLGWARIVGASTAIATHNYVVEVSDETLELSCHVFRVVLLKFSFLSRQFVGLVPNL